MNDLRGPGELNFESTNLSEAWAKWKRSMQYYLVATCKDRGEDEKVAIFMCMIGRQGQDIRDTFEFELDKDGTEIVTVPMLFQKFEHYCKPRKNLIVERHRFLTRNQEQSETIDQYVTKLKTLATSCEWGDIKDDLICSRIVSGIVSTRVRERLLREPELKLTRAIEICQADELSLQQLKLFNNDKEVDLINRPLQQRGKNIPKSQREDKKSKQDYRDESKAWKKCADCGNKHPKQKCPAFGRQCNKCKKFNHYAKMCRSSGKLSAIETKGSKQEEIGDDFLFLDTIKAAVNETRTQGQNQAEYATLCVNKTEVKLKLDTGAEVNVIPIKTYKILASARRIPLRKPTVNLVAYNGKPVPVKAVCNLQCKYRGEEYDLEFYISEVPSEPVLSVAACKELNLVKFTQELKSESVNDSPSRSTRQFSENEYSEQIRTEYLDVFSGLGCLSRPYHMEVDPKAEPVIHPPRKVPHPLRDQLAETLEDMVKQGVLEKVDGPSDWVNSMVVVQKKDGSLRICIDPKDLNRALKREHYQLPTIEEITARMPGACYFSTLDARSGYWLISLDKESCKLTTFNTPFGRFRFTRMTFGIRSAQEVFHKRIHEIFKDIRGVETDIDDILVWGRTLQEHDDRLKATLDRARECNLKFKLEKCHFRKTSVVYIGHKLTPEGIKPDPEKIEAIVNMPEPEDKKGVQRLLGMVTYVGKFVPNLSEITSPLRELLKKDVAWHWSDRHANAFEEIKTLLSNPQPGVLAYYDVTKSVKLQVDASKSGLGAVLIQSNMPIAYASRSLTSAETRYAQIEKELLAVVFGCNRFRQYIYGKQITVESDHQPLEAIMKKSLDKSPLRLQRMLLNLQSYDVDVKYRPGNELYLADTLSRAHLSNCKSEEETLDLDYQAISMISKLPVSDGKLRQIKEETKKDGTMQALVKIINEGWPRYKDSLPSFLQPLWNYREELTVIEGVVFKGEKIFIPHALRKSVLAKIHQSHMGIERSKQRARELVYWPGINKDIESVVKSCSVCAEHRASNQKEPMLPHAIPKYPWQIVATDMFYWNGDDYLLVVDYYSRFWEIFKVSNTKSSAIIAKMKTLFARHGIPEIVKSDNGPQYVSREFSEFAKTWGFEHITSSPMYPQSNGLAEKTVQTAKSILTKARRDNQDPNLAILEQRNTPINDIGSPARLSMGRRLRSNMPSSTDQLIPKTVNPEIVQIRLEQKQAQQKKYYDRSAKSREDLSEGDNVYVQREGEWKPAVIVSKADTPRSFNVKTADGGHYRRNSIHLRKSYDLASQSSSPEKSTENQSKKESKATKDERSQREEERGPNEETPTPTGGTASPVRTRSGRVVRKPVRYNDYV